MEGKNQFSPDVPRRQLSIRKAGYLPESNSFEEPGTSYFLDTGDRPEESEGLLNYWRILVRHKIPILAASAGGLLLGFLIGVPQKPVFRAHTTLEVLNANEDFMNMKLTQSEVPAADSDNLSEEETQASLLQNTELLDRVYEELDPNPTPPAHLATHGWRSWLHMKEVPKPSDRENLLHAAMGTIKVSNPPRTRILEISVDSKDPKLAVDFIGALVQELIKENVDARQASTQQTGDWLGHEISEARTSLQNSENTLQTYASRSGLYFIDNEKQTNVATEKLQEIQQQLSAATADRIAKQSVYELAKNSPPDTLADVLNDASLQSLSARLDDATREVASLSALYNPGYTKLQQAQAEAASLRQAFETHREDLLHRIENDYQGAARREKLLSTAYDAQARKVSGLNEKTVKYNVLKREVDSNRQLYDTMLQQMKQASIATALHASNVHTIYPAHLLRQHVSPNLKVNSALGLFVGFLSSVGFIFIREQTDRTLRHPGEVKQYASLPELGTIPRLPSTLNRKALPFLRRGLGKEKPANDSRSLKPSGRYDLLNLADVCNWPMAVPEAFHSALTSILLSGENRESGRVLVFTSAGPADGKTSVVSNIAIAAAAAGKKVLLVDADLRRPRLHIIFGLANQAGLAELLGSDADCARWPELTQKTKMEGLTVITAGNPVKHAGMLFYSPGFPNLLAKWKEEYDLVLLDTPPALAMTDARVIGILADGVVLIARAGQTTRDALLAIQERLGEDRIPLLGCILNDWDPRYSAHAYPYYGTEEEPQA